MPSQRATTGPTLIEGIKRMNAVMMCLQQRAGLVQHNLYTIEIDRGRNCYAYGEFGHMA